MMKPDMMMPQGGGGGMSGGSGNGLEQLMQVAMPLLQQMGPQSKMALGAAMQTPGVQQMIKQVAQNP